MAARPNRVIVAMRVVVSLIVAGALTSSTSAFAADYRANFYEPRSYSSLRPVYTPYVPPLYYLPSPPQYVQDLRTGGPGHWVQLQPTWFERLFREPGNGY
jgi:hypothetical protein